MDPEWGPKSLRMLFFDFSLLSDIYQGSRTIRTLDCSYPPGLFVPWTIRTITGRFVHVEKGNIVYTVWVKKIPPQVFWHFFPKRLEIFSPNFTCLLYVHTYGIGLLQIFIQLSPTLTNLYHIKCDHPAYVRFGRWWTFRAYDGGRA